MSKLKIYSIIALALLLLCYGNSVFAENLNTYAYAYFEYQLPSAMTRDSQSTVFNSVFTSDEFTATVVIDKINNNSDLYPFIGTESESAALEQIILRNYKTEGEIKTFEIDHKANGVGAVIETNANERIIKVIIIALVEKDDTLIACLQNVNGTISEELIQTAKAFVDCLTILDEPVQLTTEKEDQYINGRYYLSAGPFMANIDEKAFYVLSKNTPENSSTFKHLKIKNKEEADRLVARLQLDLYIVPKEKPDTDVIIAVRIKDKKYEEIGSFSLLYEQYGDTIMETLVAGFGATQYEIYEKNGFVYCLFDVAIDGIYQKRYATIEDGDMIYIWAEKNEPLTEMEMEYLRCIVDSITKE